MYVKRHTKETKKKMQEAKRTVPQPVVEAIRQCRDAGMTFAEIKEKFPLSKGTLSNIINDYSYTY